MTIYKRIALKNLIVNPANDRHGELATEEMAIEWLLVNKTEKMKDLLDDIVARNGRVMEQPLVMMTGGDTPTAISSSAFFAMPRALSTEIAGKCPSVIRLWMPPMR